MHTARPECIHGPAPIGRMPGGMEYEIHTTGRPNLAVPELDENEWALTGSVADPSPEIFEDWEAISLIRQNVYEDEPTGLADLLRSATRTERDECFEMLEQVKTGRLL